METLDFISTGTWIVLTLALSLATLMSVAYSLITKWLLGKAKKDIESFVNWYDSNHKSALPTVKEIRRADKRGRKRTRKE